jgi:hypothetical protein
MDGRQFDRWTRGFAGMSRRDATKLLVSLSTGSLAGAGVRATLAQVAPEACGRDGDRCSDNGDCCNNFRCRNDRCRDRDSNDSCGNDGDTCTRNNDCCNNFECRNDRCRETDSCGRNGDTCARNSDCCNNFECRNEECRKPN